MLVGVILCAIGAGFLAFGAMASDATLTKWVLDVPSRPHLARGVVLVIALVWLGAGAFRITQTAF
jgi:hypothetical protein